MTGNQRALAPINTPSAFNFNGNPVRVVMRDGEPWFVAFDICEALGYANSRKAVADHLDDNEKGVTTGDTPGGAQKLTIINESGLYALVLRSRKPEARKFAKWVTGEVLPAIRKTGSYSSPDKALRAQALASEVSAQVARTVFEAVMSGNDPSRDMWICHIGYDGKPRADQVAPGSMIVTLSELTRLIGQPDWICRADELAALAQACIKRIERKVATKEPAPFRD